MCVCVWGGGGNVCVRVMSVCVGDVYVCVLTWHAHLILPLSGALTSPSTSCPSRTVHGCIHRVCMYDGADALCVTKRSDGP